MSEQLIAQGRVMRGYLGATLRPISPELASVFKFPNGKGAFVVRVEPGSPAALAGLKEGDIVVQED